MIPVPQQIRHDGWISFVEPPQLLWWLGFFGAPPPRPRSSVGNIWAKPLSDGSKLRIFLGMEEMEANGSGFSRRNLTWAIFFPHSQLESISHRIHGAGIYANIKGVY